MKTTLIFIRHGFSVSNKAKIYTGSTDIDLTETGKIQAEKCAELMAKMKPDAVYSSDLKRAYETALPTANALGLEVKVEPGVREIFGGDWEGCTFAELVEKYPVEYGTWQNDIGRAVWPGGESVVGFSKRVEAAVHRIAKENEGKTVCIASHAMPIRAMCTLAKGLPYERMQEVPFVRNASVNVFEYENGTLTALSLDEVSHLGEFMTESHDSV